MSDYVCKVFFIKKIIFPLLKIFGLMGTNVVTLRFDQLVDVMNPVAVHPLLQLLPNLA